LQDKSLETLGRTFKTKREINGLTRRDVVAKIKIPMDQLESIEEGRLSSLPPVFAKGFLRAYANELGLDAEAILDDYRKMTGGFKNEPASRDALVSRYVETKISSGSGRWGRYLLAGLALLVLGLGAAFWVRPDSMREAAARWSFGGQPPEVELAGSPEEPVSYPAEPVVAGPEVAVVRGSLAVSVPEEEGAAPAEAEVPTPGGELALVCQKDGVWLQLIVDGQPAKHYWLKRGQTIVQRAETAVVVRTGQATALGVSWNRQDLGVLSGQPVVEAGFPPS
jgi:transcriptional regulator with XRE-family HTH domain